MYSQIEMAVKKTLLMLNWCLQSDFLFPKKIRRLCHARISNIKFLIKISLHNKYIFVIQFLYFRYHPNVYIIYIQQHYVHKIMKRQKYDKLHSLLFTILTHCSKLESLLYTYILHYTWFSVVRFHQYYIYRKLCYI